MTTTYQRVDALMPTDGRPPVLVPSDEATEQSNYSKDPQGPLGTIFDVTAIAPPALEGFGRIVRRISKGEIREGWIRAMSQRWNRPMTVVVANTKGGAGKSPLSVLIASAFGAWSGQTPVLIDNNPQGNLFSRLENQPARYFTMADVAASYSTLSAGDLWMVQQHLINQSSGNFLALPRTASLLNSPDGTPRLAPATLTEEEVESVWKVVTRVSGIVVVDAGNNPRDPQWQGILRHADALVVPIKWQKDHCDEAVDMLRMLDITGHNDLARNAIVVESVQSKADVNRRIRQTYSHHFQERYKMRVLTIPTDAHIGQGVGIEWNRLQKATREAALILGAEISQRFTARED